MTTITNLAFKGGGVLGIAYIGALKVLEDQNILPQIERVAGTSAGAITATLVSLRYNATEAKTIVNGTSFRDFEDKKNILRLFSKYGLYAGDAALNWIGNLMPAKGLSKDATFRDFKNHGCLDLSVFATDLNTHSLKEFSFAKTPDVIVAQAVRASMSIPMFFKVWTFPNNNPDNHLYVDGGTIFNFPIDAFDTGLKPNPATMGLYLANVGQVPKVNNLKNNEIFRYVKIVFETLLEAQGVHFKNDPEQVIRTAIIDDLGISATNFDLSKDQQEALYQSGIKCTTEYLANRKI